MRLKSFTLDVFIVLIDLFILVSFLPNTFILLVTYRSALNSSGTLFSLLETDRLSIFEMKIHANITVTYRYENKTEELHFHRTNFIANDGVYVFFAFLFFFVNNLLGEFVDLFLSSSWHRIVLLFGLDMVRLRYNEQTNSEIKLPLTINRSSGHFSRVNAALLATSAIDNSEKETFFKVTRIT
jgi:hypothetical protein